MPGMPAFQLADLTGRARAFPAHKLALLCFVKDDCPTCHLVMPVLEAAHAALDGHVDVWAIGQDAAGNARMARRHGLSIPMLDDSALKVSFAHDIDTVPTVIFADGEGNRLNTLVGFDREQWRGLFGEMADALACDLPAVDWDALPRFRPGCGSRSVEPEHAERLAAEATGSPLRARTIEVGDQDDVFEFMFDHGLTDGLPVVPPTPERVLRLLGGTRRAAQDVVALVPPNLAPATVEKVAVNAVMAGCRPDYLPVVIAAVEAVCTDAFNAHGVASTTWGASPVLVVNGPIRHRLGMGMGVGALGAGNRANATIGRAVRLVLRNVGGAKTGGIERSTLGTPAKFTLCFAENEEASSWPPLHAEHGFAPGQDVVTAFALEGSRQVSDQRSRTARGVATSLALAAESVWHPKMRNFGDILVVVCPEHAEVFRRDGWTKEQVRARMHEATLRPLRALAPDDDCGEGVRTDGDPEALVPKFCSPANIHLVVAGGEAGKFSAVFGGWMSGAAGSIPVSRVIEA